MMPNVLLIMVDALRADRCWGVNRYCRTPVLDEFISKSTTFTKAFSTASMTVCCTSSILTGSYPFVHGIRSLSDRRLRSDIPTLGESFQMHGYYTFAEVSGPLLPATRLNRGFDDYRHRDYKKWLDTSWGVDLISRFQTGLKKPWFGFLHLWELHHPRRVTRQYATPDFGRNLYERAVSSFDNQLGKVLDALSGDTWVILTGDHGEYVSDSDGGDLVGRLKRPFKWLKKNIPGMRKLRRVSPTLFAGMDRLGQKKNAFYYNWIGHGYHVYDYLVNVPLILYGPGIFPHEQINTQLVSHVDIFPTLVSALNLSKSNSSFINGIDLMPMIRKSEKDYGDRAIYLEASGGRTTPRHDQWLSGIRTQRFKYIRGLFNDDLPEELYSLEKDPQEQVNLVRQLPDVANMLRSQLDKILNSASDYALTSETTYSSEELAQFQDRLHDLGYLD